MKEQRLYSDHQKGNKYSTIHAETNMLVGRSDDGEWIVDPTKGNEAIEEINEMNICEYFSIYDVIPECHRKDVESESIVQDDKKTMLQWDLTLRRSALVYDTMRREFSTPIEKQNITMTQVHDNAMIDDMFHNEHIGYRTPDGTSYTGKT